MGYLYLFYSDYIHENPDPQTILQEVKNQIKRESLQKLQTASNYSATIEQAFEQKYNIPVDSFGALDIRPSQEFNEANIAMNNFDDVIQKLKQLILEGGLISDAQTLGQQAVSAIDTLLTQGALTGGLAEGAYDQLQEGLQKLKTACQMTRYKGTGGKQWKEKDEILNLLKDVESNVSGYALELATVYGAVGSSHYTLKALHETMINIGSNTLGTNITKTFRNDPQVLQDLQELEAALQSNNGIQSKADSVINMHMTDGQGSVIATPTWVGFQQKNYRNISNVTITQEKTLWELGFFNYYDGDMIVNIAGSLGNNYQKRSLNIDWETRRHYKDNLVGLTQGELDKEWNEAKNSMKMLLAADAIAGKMKDNFTNKINYYVIREKGTSKIRVIGVSRILDKIALAINNDENSSLGINWGYTKGKYSHRQKYWQHSISNFDVSNNPNSKYVRSFRAYPAVLSEIANTKIAISLNFSSFFQ